MSAWEVTSKANFLFILCSQPMGEEVDRVCLGSVEAKDVCGKSFPLSGNIPMAGYCMPVQKPCWLEASFFPEQWGLSWF